jgi:hypothetical protein
MRSRWRLVLICLVMTIGAGTAEAQRVRNGVVPAGARMSVRTAHPIFANHAWVGMRVPGTLDSALFDSNGRILVPRGSQATLEVVGVRTRGRDRVTLAVDSVHVGRRTFPVATNHVTMTGPTEGGRTARNAAGGAIGGAVVGGMIGGGSGAAVGAATGGTAGAMASGSGRRNVTVPAHTRIQFRTFGPVPIRR